MPPMSIYWDDPLSEPVKLKCGTHIRTLLDAAHFVECGFPGPVRYYVFDLYTKLLIASRSGCAEDKQAATNQLKLALTEHGLV